MMEPLQAWTTFAIGTEAAQGRTMQPLPDGVTSVVEFSAPEGVNPSKVGTWIQRRVADGVLPAECPPELAETIELGAAALATTPTTALAIDMTGNPAGDKMRVRLEATEGERAWLVFGLTPS
jgi:hypothetical protein